MSGPTAQANASSTTEYLELYSGNQPGYLTLWTKRTRAHTHFHTSQLAHAAAFALASAEAGDDVYVRSNLQRTADGTRAETVSLVTVLTIDFDIAGPGHKAPNLPTEEQQFDELCRRAGAPPPTVTLRTGGGLLGVWSLESPIPVDSPETLSAAKRTSAGFQGRLRQVAAEQGFHLDVTSDLVRACRIPGTRNWKYGATGASVSVREWTGRQLSSCDVDSVVEAFFSTKATRGSGTGASTLRKTLDRNGRSTSEGHPASWPAIYEGCDALRKWADTVEGLPEPQWYALAGVVSRCAEGFVTFHELSKGDPRYNPEETEQKLAQAVDASPPRRCGSIRDLGGQCNACPFQGRINSPIALGYAQDPALVQLARDWAYVAAQDAFIDLRELEVTR